MNRRLSLAVLVLLSSSVLAACAGVGASTHSGAGAEVSVPRKVFPQQSKAAVVAAVSEAGAQLGWKATTHDPDAGVTVFQTPMSLLTYGDSITVLVKDEGEGVVVDLTSTSSQQIDWGKNKDNIEKFYAALGSILGVSS